MIRLRMASMSPPVLRSMMASAPYRTASLALASSSSTFTLSREVPRLTFTLTRRPSPMPHGVAPWIGLSGMTTLPEATSLRSFSGSILSFLATASISSVGPPLAPP